MELKLNIPLLVRTAPHFEARPQDARVWRIAYEEVAAEVRSVPRGGLPEAFRWRTEFDRSDTVYLWDEKQGCLLRRLSKVSKVAENQDVNTYSYLIHDHPLRSVFESMKARRDTFAARDPESVSERRGDRDPRDFLPVSSYKGVDVADLRESREAVRAAMERCVIVGDALWTAADEPVFSVYRTNVGWKAELLLAPSVRAGRDRRVFHFGIGQFDEMVQFKDELAQSVGRHSTRDTFAMTGIYEPTNDGYKIDLVTGAEDIMDRIARYSVRLGRTTREVQPNLLDLPLPAVELFARLRRFAVTPQESMTDEACEEMVAVFRDMDAIARDIGMEGEMPSMKELEWQIAKWESRPMQIAPVALAGHRL